MMDERRRDYPSILAKLGVLDERSQHMLKDISGKDGIREQCVKMNSRISKVENRQSYVDGTWGAITFILILIVPTVIWLVFTR